MTDKLDALPPWPSADDYENAATYYADVACYWSARNEKLCKALRGAIGTLGSYPMYDAKVAADEARAVLAACEVKDNE